MQLVTLVKNHKGSPGSEAQHGQSLWLNSGGCSFLFDKSVPAGNRRLVSKSTIISSLILSPMNSCL